jgi:hypothetical protein
MVEARQEFCGETVPDAPEFVRDADCQGGVPPGERLGKSVELGFEGGEASEPLVQDLNLAFRHEIVSEGELPFPS